MTEEIAGAAIISLDEWRRRQRPWDSLTEFTRALDELMQAMELLREAPPSPAADAAYEAVYAACRMLLDREERIVSWTRR